MKYFKVVMVTVIIVAVTNILIYSQQRDKDSREIMNLKPVLSWKQDANSLSLLNRGKIVWRLNYDKSEDKPYFYPLRTLNGIDLALPRPHNHHWHRGLWFAWQLINGVNYWEEDPKTGVSPGRTKILNVDTQLDNDYSAKVTIDLAYVPEVPYLPRHKAVMHEYRMLKISAPDEQGNYRIDWTLQFTAGDQSLLLNRIVPLKHGGLKWGGYAGLGFRANDKALDSIRFIDSNYWSRSNSISGYGKGANWMDLSGSAQKENDKKAGLTIFDHKDNPRHPTTWYVSSNKKSGFVFFMPAFLFDDFYKLPAGASFTLRYRALAHEGMGEYETLNKEYQSYIQQ